MLQQLNVYACMMRLRPNDLQKARFLVLLNTLPMTWCEISSFWNRQGNWIRLLGYPNIPSISAHGSLSSGIDSL